MSVLQQAASVGVKLLHHLGQNLLSQYQSQPSSQPSRLQAREGGVLQLELHELSQPLHFAVQHGRLVLTQPKVVAAEAATDDKQYDQAVFVEAQSPNGQPYDCRIRCRVATLAKLQDTSKLSELIQSGELQLEGDVQLAGLMAEHLHQIAFDGEAWLAQRVGDVPAHLLSRGMRHGLSTLQRLAHHARLDLTELLQDEVRLNPTHYEVDYFCQQTQDVQQRADALEARLAALAARRTSANNKPSGERTS